MNRQDIHCSVACNLDKDLLLTLLPLFADSEIDAIEWSFDAVYQRSLIPNWFYELLQAYAENQRLIAHGIYFSIFSGRWKLEQQQWLNNLKILSQKFGFDHVTEHFGFTSGANFHVGAPLSIPMNDTTLDIGLDRMKRIQQAANCPVGLENLAFAYHPEEVKKQGNFLNQLITPVNGFIILDLHNIYCQAHNFGIEAIRLINYYPLERVREIHISGGSWEPSRIDTNRIIRRDTHDDSVPVEVFKLLETALPLCSSLKYVVLEQMGTALKSEIQRAQFRSDFIKMKKIVSKFQSAGKEGLSFLMKSLDIDNDPIEDEDLYSQQISLSDILEGANDLSDAKSMLSKSALVDSDWQIEKWDDSMLDTAILIAQKWKKGFN